MSYWRLCGVTTGLEIVMSGVKCRKWIVRSYFDGLPKNEDLEIIEEELQELQEGDYMLEAVWLSVDPYMRPYTKLFPLNQPMVGSQVAKVIQSKNEKLAVGDYVLVFSGWVSHCVANDNTAFPFMPLSKVELPPEQLSHALGLLGMTGLTAYFGLLEICCPKEGETLVVNCAAGAVGSVVGQIAKIKGCHVVGYAGTDAKVEYLKSIGYDAAYNYKTIPSLKDSLAEACPKGIDMFFDNVGGEFFSTVVGMMNTYGRVALCGAISEYHLPDNQPLVESVARSIVFKQIKIEGFILIRWQEKIPQALKELLKWIDEGKLKAREHVVEGFDNMFDAFMGLFRGDNIGKIVVKA